MPVYNLPGRFLAYLLHPSFLFAYACLLFFGADNWKVLFLFTILLTILLPVLLTYLLQKEVILRDRKRRIWPLLAAGLSYLLAFFVLKYFQPPALLLQLLIAFCIGLFAIFLINLKFKISLHASGLATFSIFLYIVLFQHFAFEKTLAIFLYVFWILLVILTLHQRLSTKSHSLAEILSGFLLGCLAISAVFYLT